MNVTWEYEYSLGTLYQHSAKLTEHYVISPFFVLERESGACLWEKSESATRDSMLAPTRLDNKVVCAEKYVRIDARDVLRGDYRFDLMTGDALTSPDVGSHPSGNFVAALSRWLGLRRPQTAHNKAGSEPHVQQFRGSLEVSANATSVTISGIGDLFPGIPSKPESLPSVEPQFWQNWPMRFYLRSNDRIIWQYDDQAAQDDGLTGSVTYDKIRAPFAYSLLYRVTALAPKTPHAYLTGLSLRRLDLHTGQVVQRLDLSPGPIHKWPSIVDVDASGAVVLWRDAVTDRSTITYVTL